MSATRRTPGLRRLGAACTALALGAVMTACSSGGGDHAAPEATTPTSLAEVDTGAASLTPRDPCAGIDAAVMDEVVGGVEGEVETWQPGDTLPGTEHVIDEYGCRVRGQATASAWVFATPVTPAQARGLVREATAMKCQPSAAPTFGSPGVAVTCTLNTGRQIKGVRGLLDDVWVACEVHGTEATTATVERWCAAVLESLSA